MTPTIIQYFQENTPLFIFSAALLGLTVGSFLNVVIYRLPVMLERNWRAQCKELFGPEGETSASGPSVPEGGRFNLATPPSTCPHCGHRIGALENIPLLSYLLQRGCCRHCGAPIGLRYPIVEALTGLLTALVAWHFGFGWPAAAAMVLSFALIALAFIDLDHQLLPDDITLPFLWLGLILSLGGVFVDSHASIIGAAAGYLTLWGVYQLFKLVTGKEGMGYGDFKLLAVLGAWLGWQALPAIILLSSAVGALVGIGLILFRGHGRQIPIPFGPYLAAAGWLALMWGRDLTDAYLRWNGL